MKAKLQQLGVWCQQLLYKGHGQPGVDLVYNLKGNTTFIKKRHTTSKSGLLIV